MEQTCKKCGETKTIEEFMKYQRNGNLYYRYRCRKCYNKGILSRSKKEPNEKRCVKCNEIKTINAFRIDHRIEKHRGVCKICEKKGYDLRKDRILESARKSNAKYRASGRARENWKKWAELHPDILSEKRKEYYNKHWEFLKEKRALGKDKWDSRTKRYLQNYRKRKRSDILASSRKYTLKAVEAINDSYSKSLLKHKGYKSEDISKYPELIECQRIITKIKRLANENSNRP